MKTRGIVKWAVAITAMLASSIICAAGGSTALSAAQREQLALAIALYAERSASPAVSVYVDEGGSALFRADVGLADVGARLAVGPESVYGIGSITKSFTAHAVLTLSAAGRLHLEDTVASLLTDYQGPGSGATVQQLLLHTSGIPNYVNEIPGLTARLRRGEMQRPDMLATFASQPLAFTPGSRWSYSNSGYYLLGLIIERVSGKSYYEFLRDDVLRPMGITQVWSGDDREIVPNRVRGYELNAGLLQNATPWYFLVPFSAGSLFTTAEELARYRRAVFTSAAVPAAVRSMLTVEVPLSGGESTGYTQGAMVHSRFGTLNKYAHSGEIWGYSAANAYYPERDTTIVVLTNLKGPTLSAISLERAVARIVLGVPAAPIQDGKLSDQALARYTGRYALTYKRIGPPTLSFLAKGGRLYFAFGAASDTNQMLMLQPAGPDRFVLAADPETGFQFESAGSRGAAREVVLDALNSTFPAMRTP